MINSYHLAFITQLGLQMKNSIGKFSEGGLTYH